LNRLEQCRNPAKGLDPTRTSPVRTPHDQPGYQRQLGDSEEPHGFLSPGWDLSGGPGGIDFLPSSPSGLEGTIGPRSSELRPPLAALPQAIEPDQATGGT